MIRITARLAACVALALSVGACGAQESDDADDTAPAQGSASDSASASADASSEGEVATAAYFVTDGPLGARLAREFQPAGEGLVGAVEVLGSEPMDPDYTNPAQGWVTSAEAGDDTIQAVVTGAVPDNDPLVVQQVVYTLQAAAGDTLPVQFVDESGADVTDLGGASNPVSAADQLETLLLVSISDPAEGATVSGTLSATGRASSFENNVLWEIRDGSDVVLDGYVTAEGDWATTLGPWSTDIDISSLSPGTYTFAALTDDPSGGEGAGPSEDTRTIVVE